MRHIYKVLLFSSTMLVGGNIVASANPFALDTLQREMILQRDYQPVGQQADKAFFNPLQTTSTSLRPISFARNTYPIAMNVAPKLFNPLDNPLAPKQIKQTLHAHIFGGFPGQVGANIGVLAKTSEEGSLLVSADHLSRCVNLPQMDLPLIPVDRTHDTEVALDYTHALADRVINVGVDVFHHANTYYGTYPVITEGVAQLTAEYPLAGMVGTEVRVGISPSPLSLARGVQYSVDGKAEYISKDDIAHYYTDNNILIPKGTTPFKGNKVSELSVDLGGNLGYKFAGTDWSVGVDGRYQMISISALGGLSGDGLNPMMALSIDPYFAYTAPSFELKAGARLQLLNRGTKKFLVTPDVQARFKATENFSIYLNADGGAKYHTLRDIYRQNRWADAMSVYKGYEIAQYRIVAGIQVGNINGFSLDLNGGYTLYSDFSDWMTNYHVTEYANELVKDGAEMRQILTPLYGLRNAGKVGNMFFGGKVRYNSPTGLDLGASLKYNSYRAKDTSRDKVGYGRPTYEIGISADYAVNDKIGLNINLTGLGGIKFPELLYLSRALVPEETLFIGNLGARISYKVHPNIGLSLIGENLANQKLGRWRGYDRKGSTAILAATFSF